MTTATQKRTMTAKDVFPGDGASISRRVVVHRICWPCHTQHGRPMPPRRAARRKAHRV